MIFVYFCRLTAAAALAVSVKRGRLLDAIECEGPLPPNIPLGYPVFPTLLDLCADRAGHPRNAGCKCIGEALTCGLTNLRPVMRIITYCLRNCNCGPNTKRVASQFITEFKPPVTSAGIGHAAVGSGGAIGTINEASTLMCSGTCTSVNRGCDWAFDGDCLCTAPPVSLWLGFGGNCATTHDPSGLKRDLAHQRRSSNYLNTIAKYGSPHDFTISGPPPKFIAQFISGLVPSPCNASYVSFACSTSPDGIVQEPRENWLGALLPENAREIPPVPEDSLRLHNLKDLKPLPVAPVTIE